MIFICDFDPYGKGKYRYTRKEIKKKLDRGDSVEKISDDLMENVEVIEQVIQELSQ